MNSGFMFWKEIRIASKNIDQMIFFHFTHLINHKQSPNYHFYTQLPENLL